MSKINPDPLYILYKLCDRLKLGLEFENRVKIIFAKVGLKIFKCGLGTLPDSAKENIIGLNAPTSLLLRFSPDYFCIILNSPLVKGSRRPFILISKSNLPSLA